MEEKINTNDNDSELQTDDIAEYGQYNFTTTPIEQSVVSEAAKGDEAAFETLFIGTYRYVFAVTRKYLKNDQDAYDAIQDTYTKVYKNLSNLESHSSFYPWLHRIAENCAKDVLRLSGREASASWEMESEEILSEDQNEKADVSADITEVLKQLPKEQADLLIRVYYDKMRVAEIARMNNIPVSTVHNRLKAAKKKLKELLKIRGIDKPLYSGEVVSMIATAIRNFIGTELLSLAVAQEILHKVTNSANKKEATVVAIFARKNRNRAAKRIANALILVAVLLTLAVLITTVILINRTFKRGGDDDKVDDNLLNNATFFDDLSSTASSSLSDDVTSSYESTSAITGNSSDDINSLYESSSTVAVSSDGKVSSNDKTSSSTESSKYYFFPMIPETEVTLTGSVSDKGSLGTFSENDKLPIAATNDTIYAVAKDALVSVKKGSNTITTHCRNFGSLYTEKSSFLNVYDGRVYWIDTESNSRFILNRANLDGSEHYSVVFKDRECTYLTKLLVTKTGVYFTAGIHGVHEHIQSGTLYRTNYDFGITAVKQGIADYTIVGDKLYYIEGKYNYGDIYHANRNTLEKISTVFADHIDYGSLYSFGDYLVANRNNRYGHTEGGCSPGYAIIDTRTGKTVRRVEGEGTDIEILDVSGYDGGTLIYRRYKQLLVLNIESGLISDYTADVGVIFGTRKYYFDADTQSFMMCDIKTNKKYRLY